VYGVHLLKKQTWITGASGWWVSRVLPLWLSRAAENTVAAFPRGAAGRAVAPPPWGSWGLEKKSCCLLGSL